MTDAPNKSAPEPAVSDEDFLKQFEMCTWPLEHWHHRQHIKAAYLYLRRWPFDEAMDRIRQRIKSYNAAHYLPDLLDSGYHETMTQAWMRLVHLTLSEYGPAENADAFYERSPQLWQKKILRLFYSREVFVTARAKAEFVEADLTPLPRSSKSPATPGT